MTGTGDGTGTCKILQLFTQAILIALVMPLAVFAQDEAETEGHLPDDVQELSPDEFDRFLEELEEQGFAELPKRPKSKKDERDYSGEWIEEDGVRFCDGYLTRNADDEYCSTEIPEDWRPFEFDGETYYVAPLRNDHE